MTKRFFLAVPVFLVVVGCASLKAPLRSDALWNIISEKCLPLAKSGDQAKNPCIEVNLAKGEPHGYVVFKDRVGELQYLLMPTAKITGIESAELLNSDVTNYFDLAWKARSYMERKHGSAIAPEAVSLAVNSQYGRSQNQLHIHVSCPKPEVQAQIAKDLMLFHAGWAVVPGGVLGHEYFAKKISVQDLENKNAFKLLAEEVPGAKEHMGEFGLALVAVKNKAEPLSLVLLASRVDRTTGSRGSIEEIQNHDCPQLKVANK
ncbi:CDP-diacylglycerol diphosphatase [Bdellovibrio bacteriovorus]|uniref:CDP-diacylglycerol diphosphatase n=1 Tax=Bdellovibrio bacteriovorus TaxID=959 RepID=UPI0021CE57BC|nr:CDP-diacylglycerol diphosphatase [Bdellovibrio bacteriovorus]UXR63950.1 CDP-diacylglycerol diphosphatase [Bdellovibrio bacteriovorus]